MGIYIFTAKSAGLKTVFPKTAKFGTLEELSEHSSEDGDITYIDVSGLTVADYKKLLGSLKNSCKGWGIIDPKGSIKDVATLFFEGASDYLGPGVLKEAIEPKHFKQAVQWRKEAAKAAENADEDSAKGEGGSTFLNSSIKLPAVSAFPGWKKMETGKVMPFYLLYCSLQGKVSLDDRLDEKTVAKVHKRFLNVLDNNFYKGDGLLWMNSGRDCLFLIPPRVKNVEEAIKASLNVIISAPQITLEALNISIPANFVFALHYGSITYKPPGRTGTIVSDAINFVFHLGAKKAEPGRLTVSGELPGVTIPKSLQDCFSSAGEFEGRKIWHTKKFSYPKPWV
ncbi:MAG: hypothetical protein LBI28_06805 [Treponema sp.]|jgi:hypothetical protein|nr:hypothetical protein [Treponema sp.]